jgi:hypothetical protein
MMQWIPLSGFVGMVVMFQVLFHQTIDETRNFVIVENIFFKTL